MCRGVPFRWRRCRDALSLSPVTRPDTISPRDEERLDAALTHYQTTYPLWDLEGYRDLVNHGPMASEALVALGRADALEALRGWYHPDHLRPFEVPLSAEGVDPVASRGDFATLPQQTRWFLDVVREEDPLDGVRTWLPRLMPGALASALHGTLRLAHGVRAYQRAASEIRRDEIAFALSLFSSTYLSTPGEAGATPSLASLDAVASVPRVPDDERTPGLITHRVQQVRAVNGFAEAVEKIDVSGDLGAQLSSLTGWAARRLLAERAARGAYLHATTSTAAIRLLLPLFSETAQRQIVAEHVRALMAVHAAYDTEAELQDEGKRALEEAPNVPDAELIARAVASENDHVIKLTEAVLREDAISADPARRAAVMLEIHASVA